jgi:hypothetical protein
MIESSLLQIDPLTGAELVFHYDHAEDNFIIEEKVDVQPHIDYTKELFKYARSDWKGDWHHVASIPAIFVKELTKKGVLGPGGRILDKAALKKWVNDPDNRAFRVKPGQV